MPTRQNNAPEASAAAHATSVKPSSRATVEMHEAKSAGPSKYISSERRMPPIYSVRSRITALIQRAFSLTDGYSTAGCGRCDNKRAQVPHRRIRARLRSEPWIEPAGMPSNAIPCKPLSSTQPSMAGSTQIIVSYPRVSAAGLAGHAVRSAGSKSSTILSIAVAESSRASAHRPAALPRPHSKVSAPRMTLTERPSSESGM